MNLIQMQARLANQGGLARVKLRIVGHADAEGYVDLTCVETIVDDDAETVVLSDEASVEVG